MSFDAGDLIPSGLSRVVLGLAAIVVLLTVAVVLFH